MSILKTSLSVAASVLFLTACGATPTTTSNTTAVKASVANNTPQTRSKNSSGKTVYAPTGHYGKAPSAVVHGDLFDAAKTGDLATIRGLLDQGANANSTNKQGETPLHAAASANQSQVAMLLIQKGANVNSTTVGGWTPLHTAARFKATQVLTLLIAKGANLNAVNADGRTPEQLARAVKNVRMASLLRYHAGK
jgi:ankyrin repeat protein